MGSITSVLPERDSRGRKINYGGKHFRGIEARVARVREMILEGFSTYEIRNATGTSPQMITKIRATLPVQMCGCGRPASHMGICTYRALINKERNARYAAPLTARCKRLLARHPELAQFFSKPNFEAAAIRTLVGKFLRTGKLGPTEIAAIVAVSDADAARERERAAGMGREYVGVVGTRLLDLHLRVLSVAVTKERPSGIKTFTARACDDEGNLFVWNGCRRMMPDIGETYLMDGNVQAHEERDGLNVTFITRVTFPDHSQPKHEPNMEDKGHVWMAQIAKGSEIAFARLRECYLPFVKGIAFGILRDHAAAEDIAQYVFLYIWQHSKRYAFKGYFQNWLRVVTKHKALQAAYKRRRMLSLDDSRGIDRAA